MNARAPVLAIATIGCLCGTGCYKKSLLRAEELQALRQPGHGELVLDGTEGRTRIGPNTKVRFHRADDQWSAWIDGRELCVTSEAVFRCSSLPSGAGIPWSEVAGLETKNLNGAATYFTIFGAIVGTAAVVALTVAVVGGLAKGGGGFPRIDSISLPSGGGVQGSGAASSVAAGPVTPVDFGLQYALAQGWEWYGPPLAAVAHAPVERRDSLLPVPLPGPRLALVEPQPLFTPATSRRGYVRFVGTLEGGTDFTASPNGVGAASVALRLFDVAELGGGVRTAVAPERPDDPSARLRQTWLGFGRLLLHFDFDQERRVAAVLGAECGAGDPQVYGRAIYGLRVRLVDGLSVGLYPYNASLSVHAQAGRQRRELAGFSFPSTLELSYAF
ncbi:MAG: hypothetical protein QM765_44940 [Myxococcales bacterium]